MILPESTANSNKLLFQMFRRLLTVLLQLAGISSFAWAIHYQAFRINMPVELAPDRLAFGGVWKYLTFLNMCLQCIFFTVAFFSNFSNKLTRLRDLIFASAAFPIGLFVGVTFWSLWAIDRELIFPAKVDPYIPALVNHLMHTSVIPLQLGELFLVRHKYPKRRTGFTITALICIAYLVWINIIYYYGGFWVYPVFKVLSPVQRVGFMALCGVVGGFLYLAGELLNYAIWGNKHSKMQ